MKNEFSFMETKMSQKLSLRPKNRQSEKNETSVILFQWIIREAKSWDQIFLLILGMQADRENLNIQKQKFIAKLYGSQCCGQQIPLTGMHAVLKGLGGKE